MASEDLAEHNGQGGGRSLHSLADGVTGRVQKPKQVTGLSGKDVCMEVHHIPRTETTHILKCI